MEPNMEKMLVEIRDQLIAQDVDASALNESLRQLQVASKPSETMNALAPLLFSSDQSPDSATTTDGDGSFLSSSSPKQALQILGFLVSSDPNSDSYLKAAARSVKEHAMRAPASTLHVTPELLAVIIQQLTTGADVEASQHAAQALAVCCQKLSDSQFTTRVVQGIVHAWREATDRMQMTKTNRVQASTTAVRCADAVVAIAVARDSAMVSSVAAGAFDLFLSMLTDGKDPLLQMSALDLLEKMSESRPMHHARARWLFTPAVTQPVLQLAGGLQDGSPDPILGGPALKVVAAMCKLGQRDAALFGLDDDNGGCDDDRDPHRLVRSFHCALHNFQASGELDRLAMVDAISSFATSSSTALHLVLDDPVTRDAWLSLKVAQPRLKSAILMSVALVLDPKPEVDAAGDCILPVRIANDLGMKLFANLGSVNGPEATELVLSLTASPLPELRIAAYVLLEAVAKLATGGQLLFIHGGFYSFLTSREGESTKEGREAKYSLIHAVLASEVKGLLAEEIVRELEKYIAQGPHYVKTLRWEVAEQ